MAQAIMAVLLQKPGTARGRPSSLLKKDEDYEKVFSADFPIEVFRASIELLRLVEAHLRSDDTLTPEERVNLKFHMAMYLAALACGSTHPTPEQIKNLAGATIEAAMIKQAAQEVRNVYQILGGNQLVAKGSEFGDRLLERLNESSLN